MALIDVEIDGCFNSLMRVKDGVAFSTRIIEWGTLSVPQLTSLSNWAFDWPFEAENCDKRVAALLVQRSRQVQGLMSFEEQKNYVFVHLIESAPHNRGPRKRYKGVPSNLFGFACLRSQRLGFEAAVAFDAKNELIEHYADDLGATRVGTSQRMIIKSEAGMKLIAQTFKVTDQWPA